LDYSTVRRDRSSLRVSRPLGSVDLLQFRTHRLSAQPHGNGVVCFALCVVIVTCTGILKMDLLHLEQPSVRVNTHCRRRGEIPRKIHRFTGRRNIAGSHRSTPTGSLSFPHTHRRLAWLPTVLPHGEPLFVRQVDAIRLRNAEGEYYLR